MIMIVHTDEYFEIKKLHLFSWNTFSIEMEQQRYVMKSKGMLRVFWQPYHRMAVVLLEF